MLRLVERFRPDEARGLSATWRIAIDDLRPYVITVDAGSCAVSAGDVPDAGATLRTDADTWLAMVEGRIDGIAAFTGGRLRVDGDLHLAVRLETLFTPGPAATRLIRTSHTDVRGHRVESLVAGHGTPVVLIHGLAANKLSFLPTLDGLSDRHEVHAIDLPGFGRSDKPLPTGGRYSPGWMAEVVREYLTQHRIRDAYVVGNSMGGRVAAELAMRHPHRVRGIVGLGSAVAFDEWQRLGPLLRWTRGEWAALAPLPLRADWVEGVIADLFHDPSALPDANIRAGARDVVATARDRRYRLATASAARQLAAEPAEGRHGFWARLERLRVPSLWIWGRSDRLVSHRYADRVRAALPDARVEVWDAVGHVPQFEVPDRTTARIADFVGGIEAGR